MVDKESVAAKVERRVKDIQVIRQQCMLWGDWEGKGWSLVAAKVERRFKDSQVRWQQCMLWGGREG